MTKNKISEKRLANYCYRCCEPKKTKEMQTKGKRKKKILGVCKECYEKYYAPLALSEEERKERANRHREEKRKRNQKFIMEYLADKKCIKCGISNILCLEFHHKPDAEKHKTISKMVSNGLGLKTIAREIEKCEVLCSNCHSIVTAHASNSWRLDFVTKRSPNT